MKKIILGLLISLFTVGACIGDGGDVNSPDMQVARAPIAAGQVTVPIPVHMPRIIAPTGIPQPLTAPYTGNDQMALVPINVVPDGAAVGHIRVRFFNTGAGTACMGALWMQLDNTVISVQNTAVTATPGFSVVSTPEFSLTFNSLTTYFITAVRAAGTQTCTITAADVTYTPPA